MLQTRYRPRPGRGNADRRAVPIYLDCHRRSCRAPTGDAPRAQYRPEAGGGYFTQKVGSDPQTVTARGGSTESLRPFHISGQGADSSGGERGWQGTLRRTGELFLQHGQDRAIRSNDIARWGPAGVRLRWSDTPAPRGGGSSALGALAGGLYGDPIGQCHPCFPKAREARRL